MFLPIFQYIRLKGDISALTENMEIWHQIVSWFDLFSLEPSLVGLLLISFSLFLIRQIFAYINMVYSVTVREKIIQTQRNDLFSKYLNADSTYHDYLPIGDLVNVIINEVTKSVNGVMAPVGLAVHFIMSFGYLAVLFIISWEMTLASIFVFLVASSLTKFWIRSSRLVGRELVGSNTKMSEFMIGRLRSPRLVRLSGTEDSEKKEFLQLTEYQRNHSVHGGVLSAKTSVTIEPFLIGSSMLFLYVSSTVLILQIEMIGLYLVIALRLMPIVKGILTQWQTVQRLLGSIEAIESRFQSMELSVEIDKGDKELVDINDSIKFIDVSYCYRGNIENTLKSISFDILPNKITAIVGPSGSGKSTLVDLLPRIRNTTSGRIEINNININNYTLSSLRDLTAYLPQTPQIFTGTVASHISYGKNKITYDDMKKAAQLAGASEFIENLANGYDTLLGEGAVMLSGGQNQRLDLARALARKSKILIMDEPTSNLDTESQDKFFAAIDRIRNETKTTIIMVTHNLTSIATVDQIIVLNGGKVEAVGGHDRLIKGNSWYSNACRLQNTFSK
jgi:ABC-type multidrug transport system fused ATPase/permease subunit